ncbi:efflux transporter periplasmic adaptor subunit, partial [Bacteroidota bacterium]
LGKTFVGVVTNIANSAMSTGSGTDQVTNFEVKIRMLRKSYASLVNEKQPDQSPFRPGMSATVDIHTRKEKGVLTAPIEAVTTRSGKDFGKNKEGTKTIQRKRKDKSDDENDDKPALTANDDELEVVFVLEGDKVVAKKVVTGIQDNKFIEIKSGVLAGEKVVTAPYSAISKKLTSGTSVKVVTQDELYGGATDSNE